MFSAKSVDEIAIVFSGLRPGEKLFEELLADGDTTLPTLISRLSVAKLQDDGGQGRAGPDADEFDGFWRRGPSR